MTSASIDIPLQGVESEVVSLKTDELPQNVADIIDVLSNLARKDSVLSKWIEVSIAYYAQKMYKQYEELLNVITNQEETEYVSEENQNKANYLKLLTSFAGYYLTKALNEQRDEEKTSLLERANGLLTKSKALQPLYFENFIGDGMLALAGGSFETAGSAFTTALAKKPTHFCGLLGMACVRFHQRRYKESLEYFQKCLRQQPDFVEVRRGMGLCFYYLQQYDKAEMAYERVLELDKDNVDGLIEYAFLQLVLKKSKESTKKAFEHITRAIRLRGRGNPPPVGLYLISHHYFIKGDFMEAKKFFSNCYHKTEIKELKAECLFYLGQIQHQQGNFSLAYDFYRNSEKIDGDFILNLFRLAQLLIFKGKIPEAIQRLEKIKSIFRQYGGHGPAHLRRSGHGKMDRGGLNHRLSSSERRRRRKKKKPGDDHRDDRGSGEFVTSGRGKKGLLSSCNVNLVGRVPNIEKEVLKLLTHLYFQKNQLYLSFENAKVYFRKYLSKSNLFLDVEEEEEEDVDVVDYYLFFILGVLFGSNTEEMGGTGLSLGPSQSSLGTGSGESSSMTNHKVSGRSPKITLTTIATSCFLKAKELLLFHRKIRRYFKLRKMEKVKMLYHLNNNLAVLFYKQGDVVQSRKFFNVSYYYLLAGLKMNEKQRHSGMGDDEFGEEESLISMNYGDLTFNELDILDRDPDDFGSEDDGIKKERDEDEDDDDDNSGPPPMVPPPPKGGSGGGAGMDKYLRGRYSEPERIKVDAMFLLQVQDHQQMSIDYDDDDDDDDDDNDGFSGRRRNTQQTSLDVVPFLFNYGLLLEISGEGEDAKVIYIELIKRYPRYKLFYVKLILYHLNRKEFTAALRWSKVLIHIFSASTRPESDSLMDDHVSDVIGGDSRKGSTTKSVEDQRLGYLMLGYVHLMKQEWNFAQKRFEYILKNLNENDEFALLCLGNIFLSQPASQAGGGGGSSSSSSSSSHHHHHQKEDKFLSYAAKCFEKVLMINEYNVFASLSLSVALAERGYLMDSKLILNRLKDISTGMTALPSSNTTTSSSSTNVPSGKVAPKVNFSSAMGSMIEEEVYINLGHIAFCEKHLGVASKYYEICLKRMLKKFHSSYYPILNSSSSSSSSFGINSKKGKKKFHNHHQKMKDEDDSEDEDEGEDDSDDEMNNPSLPPPRFFERMEKIIILYEYLGKTQFCNHLYPSAVGVLEKALELVQKGLNLLEPYQSHFIDTASYSSSNLQQQNLQNQQNQQQQQQQQQNQQQQNQDLDVKPRRSHRKPITEIMSSYKSIFHSLRYFKNEIRYNLGVTEHESGSKILIEQKNTPVFAEKAVQHIKKSSNYFYEIVDEITRLTNPVSRGGSNYVLAKSDPLSILRKKAENYRNFVEKDTARRAKRNLDKAVAHQKKREEERKVKLERMRKRSAATTKLERIGVSGGGRTPTTPLPISSVTTTTSSSTIPFSEGREIIDLNDDLTKKKEAREEVEKVGGGVEEEEASNLILPPPPPSSLLAHSSSLERNDDQNENKKKKKTRPTRKFQILEEMEQRVNDQIQMDSRQSSYANRRRMDRRRLDLRKNEDDDDDDELDLNSLREGLSGVSSKKKKKKKLKKKTTKKKKKKKKKKRKTRDNDNDDDDEEEELELGFSSSSSSEDEDEEKKGKRKRRGLTSSSEEEEDDDDDGSSDEEKKVSTPQKKKGDEKKKTMIGSPLSPNFGFGARMTRRQIEMKERGDDGDDDADDSKQQKIKEEEEEVKDDKKTEKKTEEVDDNTTLTGKKRKIDDLDDDIDEGLKVDDDEEEFNFDEEEDEEEEGKNEGKENDNKSEKVQEPPKKKRKLE